MLFIYLSNFYLKILLFKIYIYLLITNNEIFHLNLFLFLCILHRPILFCRTFHRLACGPWKSPDPSLKAPGIKKRYSKMSRGVAVFLQ